MKAAFVCHSFLGNTLRDKDRQMLKAVFVCQFSWQQCETKLPSCVTVFLATHCEARITK